MLRYALRTLRLSPGFTGVIILSLALGIGANTAIFSLINAVILRSLPVSHPEELIQIASGAQMYFSNPLWEQLRDRQDVFSGVFAYGQWPFHLSTGGEMRRIRGQYVSGQYFDTLGVRAALGRTLTPADDRRACPAVAVLSHGFWEREYGAKAAILGHTIRIEKQPFEIIGVTEKGFSGVEVGSAADVLVPLCAEPLLNGPGELLDRNGPGWGWLQIVARPKPGLGPSQVEARLTPLAPDLFRATVQPNWRTEDRDTYLRATLDVRPAANGLSQVRRRYRETLIVLMAIVGVVLLIACANVANLLLARGAAREREIAIRIALGSSRARVIGELLTESLLLSIAGAAAGALIAQWAARLLVVYLNVDLDLTLDLRVLTFTAGVALVTAVLFGLAPAWRSARVQPQTAMKAHSRGVVNGARFSSGKALVVVQVALSMVLLVGAGLMLSTFSRLTSLDAGFDRNRTLLATVETRRNVFREIVDRVRAIPGVEAAAASNIIPMCGCKATIDVVVDGYTPASRADSAVLFNKVTDGFFRALGTAVLAGRDFGPQDTPASPRIAIVNQSLARKYFGAVNPIGRTLRIQEGTAIGEPYTIVGVVADAKHGALRDQLSPALYLTRNQDARSGAIAYLEIRAADGAPESLTAAVRSAITAIDPGATFEFTTLGARIDASLSRERLLALLSSVFGAVALLLATIGLYGVLSYNIARRRSEIGIRMALGAGRHSVLGMVMREVALLLAAGLTIGICAAAFTTRLVANVLYEVTPTDPVAFGAAVVILAAVGCLAGYLPARRASRVDPMLALRDE